MRVQIGVEKIKVLVAGVTIFGKYVVRYVVSHLNVMYLKSGDKIWRKIGKVV